MKVENFTFYKLIISDNPDDVFDYYKVEKMHGLKKGDDIEGWCNISPFDGQLYVFINLKYCINDIRTTALVMHEMMHLAGYKYDGCWDSHEEEMITFGENETYKVVDIINKYKKSVQQC